MAARSGEMLMCSAYTSRLTSIRKGSRQDAAEIPQFADVNKRLPVLQENEVALDDEQRRACLGFAAKDSKCRVEELTIEFASRPPFLDSRGVLFQLSYRAQEEIRDEASWWHNGTNSSLDLLRLWCLGVIGNDGAIVSVWPFRTRRDFELTVVFPCFRVDEHTAADFLRCFALFADRPDSSEPDLPLPLEDLDDVDFWTPLAAPEESALRARLADRSLSLTEESAVAFTVSVPALVGDRLYQAYYKISKRRTDRSDATGAGTHSIVVALEEEPLLAGLPDNYLRRPSLAPEPTRQAFQAEPNGRVRLGPAEARAVTRDINRHVAPALGIDEASAVFLSHLPFYDADLIEVRDCIVHGRRRTRFFVWEPGLAVALDTRSEQIYELNAFLSETRGWSLRSNDDAIAYLRFWGDFVWASDGPLTMAYSREAAIPPSADPESVVVDPQAAERVGWRGECDAGDFLDASGLQSIDGDAQTGFRIRTTMRTGGELFLSHFFVDTAGSVKEENHTPLLRWKSRPGSSWRPDEPGPADSAAIGLSTRRQLRAVSTGELAAETSAGGPENLEIRDRIVCGTFAIDGGDFNSLTFVNCRFRGPARIAHISCTGELRVLNCVFENGLEFSDVTVGGRLQFADVTVCGTVRLPPLAGSQPVDREAGLVLTEVSARNLSFVHVDLVAGLLAPSLQIQGELSLQALHSLRSVDLHSGTIQNQLEVATPVPTRPGSIHGDLILDHISAKAVSLYGLEVTGSIECSGAMIEQYLALSGAYFGPLADGSYRVMPMRIGHAPGDGQPAGAPGRLFLYGTIVEKNQLTLSDIDIAGNLEAVFVRVGTGIWLEPDTDMHPEGRNRIAGDVDISGATVPSIVRIRWTDIGGSLVGRSLTAGEFRMVGAVSGSTTAQTMEQPVEVGGDISLPDARIAGEIYLAGIAAGRALNLRHTQVGGDLTLCISCKEAKDRGLLGILATDVGALRSSFPTGVNLRKSTIAGDVVLSGVNCPEGSIDLADSSIARDIELLPEPGRARARSLHMDGMRCEGNVDLSGLTLDRGCEANDCRGLQCRLERCRDTRHVGHVAAAGSRVGGRLRTASGEHSAEIPGSLDLGFSEISTLELSVDTFPLRGTESRITGQCDAGACGVVLQRATVGMLSVHAREDDYPRPIDLRYAEIKWWEFNRHGKQEANGQHTRRVSDEAQDYIALLEGDTGRQRHTYRAIENNLYNWGHEDAADEVHRAMRRWLRDEARRNGPGDGLLERISWYPRRIARRVGDWLTKDVTSPVRIGWLMVLWLSLSTYLFSYPGNIGPSEPGYLTLAPEVRYATDHPDSDAWGLSSGFWTALQFHVPVAAFTARDEWEPSADQPMIVFQSDGMSRRLRWNMTAEDYANLVLVVHWIAWPVVIVLASRKFLRRAQQPQ